MRILLLLMTSACAMGGAMRQANLVGTCTADDPACARKQPLAPLAIGTRFHPDVTTELPGTATPNLVLDSANPGVLAVERGALVAKAPGASAVLISTEDGAVIDFLHVWVAPATSISLARRDGDRIEGPIGLTVGEDITLVPTLWNGAQRLAGSGETTWAISGEGALAVMRDGSSDGRRLRARAPGKATVTVALGEATTTVEVEVQP